MTLLLDTHYVFALAGSPGTLSNRELRFLDTYPHRFIVSAIALWEIRLKWNALYASGTRKGPASPAEVLAVLSSDPIIDFLALTPQHAATPLAMPLAHRDPFDELLLVQAQIQQLKLLSRDRKLEQHPLVTTVA
jgi:PIN domain nuclease of toxin-antitoxin system